ncbi:MAG: response regulator, partial [Planctomycetes bacterium]|nr:response regulator [Planctomycetota bacterium]
MAEPIRFSDPPPRILVVDDERMIRWSLRACFEEAGAVVDEAASLAEARRRLEEHWPSLLILDLKLPDGDGLDLLEEGQAEGTDPAALAITAFRSLRGAVEAVRHGRPDYRAKPS